MKRIKIVTLVFIALSISAFCLVRSGLMERKAAESNAPADVVVNFDASLVTERVWYGTVSGGAGGNVTVEILNNSPQILGGTWAGITRWQIVAGTGSFVAQMNGKINTYNGVLVMRGKVVNGTNAGADVLAQGQAIGINPHRFTGILRVIQP